MKKNYLLSSFFTCLLLLMLCCPHRSPAQKESNIWYFGNGGGLDFNSGSPVALSNGQTMQREGVATVSNASGSLLFYTDGLTVWNRYHLVMTNGTGLFGDPSSTQSATIVPMPGSTTKYYIFTTPGITGKFCYSIVDMTLSGGTGDISVKNTVLMATGATEKCVAIYKSGASEVWVIAHDHDTTFYAYLVTTAGVSAPVLSKNALHPGLNGFSVGYMRASPQGDKIAAVLYNGSNDPFVVYDFDCATGQVSNEKTIFPNGGPLYGGLEFSPDGSKLYVVPYAIQAPVFQFDVTLNTAAAITASKITVATSVSSYDFGAAQLGPDQKIYLTPEGSSTLSVINYPNVSGAACGWADNAVYLAGGKIATLGLPALIRGNVCGALALPPVAAFQTTDTVLCTNDCISFKNMSANATSWQWTFAGATPSTSTDENPQTVCYLTDGLFNVKLVATNSAGSDSVTLTNYINVKSSPPTPTISQNGTTLSCSTDPSYTGYQWYDSTMLIPGATDTLLVVTHSGNYNIRVTNSNDCKVAVGINIVLGMENNSLDKMFLLYPNPAAKQLTIHTSSFQNEAVTVSILDVLGQDVSTPTSLTPALSKGEGDAVIDVSSLPAGIYFLQLKWNEGRVVNKFIKE